MDQENGFSRGPSGSGEHSMCRTKGRVAQVYRLRPGARDAYIQAHREIWPEMQDFLIRAGVTQMTIFLRGDTLFLYAEIADLRAYQELERVDPVSRRWEAWMATLLEEPFDDREAGIFADLSEIWHFPLKDDHNITLNK